MLRLATELTAKEREDLLALVLKTTGIKKYSDVCLAGSRVFGAVRDNSDFDVIVWVDTRKEEKPEKHEARFLGVAVNIIFRRAEFKNHPLRPKLIEGAEGKSYLIPQLSLVSGQLMDVENKGISDWIKLKKTKSEWNTGRNFSKIIVDIPEKTARVLAQ